MKTLLLSAAFMVTMTIATNAQISKGTMTIGGSIGASFTTSKYSQAGNTVTLGKNSSFSLGPEVGWFVIDDFLVGAGIDVSTSTFKPDGDFADLFEKSTNTSYGIGPFARYYVENFFGEASVAFGGGKIALDDEDEKYSHINWSVGAGYAAFLNDHIAIEPRITYRSQSQKGTGDDEVKDVNSGVYFSVGIQAYLR